MIESSMIVYERWKTLTLLPVVEYFDRFVFTQWFLQFHAESTIVGVIISRELNRWIANYSESPYYAYAFKFPL